MGIAVFELIDLSVAKGRATETLAAVADELTPLGDGVWKARPEADPVEGSEDRTFELSYSGADDAELARGAVRFHRTKGSAIVCVFMIGSLEESDWKKYFRTLARQAKKFEIEELITPEIEAAYPDAKLRQYARDQENFGDWSYHFNETVVLISESKDSSFEESLIEQIFELDGLLESYLRELGNKELAPSQVLVFEDFASNARYRGYSGTKAESNDWLERSQQATAIDGAKGYHRNGREGTRAELMRNYIAVRIEQHAPDSSPAGWVTVGFQDLFRKHDWKKRKKKFKPCDCHSEFFKEFLKSDQVFNPIDFASQSKEAWMAAHPKMKHSYRYLELAMVYFLALSDEAAEVMTEEQIHSIFQLGLSVGTAQEREQIIKSLDHVAVTQAWREAIRRF